MTDAWAVVNLPYRRWSSNLSVLTLASDEQCPDAPTAQISSVTSVCFLRQSVANSKNALRTRSLSLARRTTHTVATTQASSQYSRWLEGIRPGWKRFTGVSRLPSWAPFILSICNAIPLDHRELSRRLCITTSLPCQRTDDGDFSMSLARRSANSFCASVNSRPVSLAHASHIPDPNSPSRPPHHTSPDLSSTTFKYLPICLLPSRV
ncbi:hypothetical protein EV421DRAFT_189785 [Armillaria borealis]|uniref:Uncharacterized protein n=1 Tax=Armillaria borealis TaxID=47425 RepID=A0AA39JSX2_9AGAR|nr:hypothetical protein EV421DRAFT_189785 [Armillaria borealis]